MKANEGKKKKGKKVNTIILIVALAVMAFALYKLIPILLEYKQADDAYDGLATEYVDAQTDDVDGDLSGWKSVQIDFESLKALNPDIIGWIRFDDLDAVAVDYPLLHGENNDEYLRSDIYGNYLISGCIFLETSNNPDFSDYYNIIYGHNMKNTSMFGALKRYKQQEGFYEDNQYFTVYTEAAAYRYQIFSYCDVEDTSNIYTVGYQPDAEYQALIDQMVASSMYDTGITPTCEDRIVTLSTCSTNGETLRFVLHAVQVDQLDYE